MNYSVKVIITKNKEFLLQLRDNKPDIFYPDHWDFFGGKVEKNENAVTAAKREFREETGLKLKKLYFLEEFYVKKNSKMLDDCIIYLFKAKTNARIEDIVLTEGQRADFFNISQIKDLKMPEHWKDYLAKNSSRLLN